MDINTLQDLLADKIPQAVISINGDVVTIINEESNTVENRAIIDAVIANYDTLVAAYKAKQIILKQIIELEIFQTPRRMRDAIAGTDNG